MNIITSNISLKSIDMIPLECVGSIKWSKDYGEKLRAIRGRRSRPSIISMLEGATLSAEALRLLEEGIAKTIQPNDFIALCNALEVHPSKIILMISIGVP